ncbi:MAG: HypC/HybG/HupF family hydrogenase formation chaperone [Endomicrobiia bacterium]|jgi:hydrogenase expression/formation protein HypC|nr:HypC/HybG/HupF family hydrogenase formation chaperone [Endomicrobiaceae bacterium]MDD3053281.1 HypC/HybG/HupF family hydrogenase formation chaperone [Endomicrobiaceae bacterium]MDD3922564.1 HypC/HybG/HupF family hydrogenase formation chaperone [Endomicrobiaceae bacterium]MDD5101704.1 HypC/HybG/HupF family hydrogenase formation chaperone [Endomicrobiaceae bacterium]
MCIANVCKVKKLLADNKALVDFSGLEDIVDIRLLKQIAIKDFLLVHAGFALQKIDKKEALKMLKDIKDTLL